VITRNIQVTVKGAKREFKTLEGSLLLRNSGERTTISSRVSGLDELVPSKLGVSSAVLDSVIFCHQDESLWPMSEPATLKKRFDEIFDASKYAKVIDNLKVLRKRKGDDLKVLVVQETNDKKSKERADKVDREMHKLTTEILESRGECERLWAQMGEEQVRIKEKTMQANSFLAIVHDLKNKREKLEFKKEAIEELQSRIEEMPDSDAVLSGILDEYEKTAERTVADRDAKSAQLRELQTELRSVRGNHTAKVAEQGKHQSDKEKYERQLATRREMVQDAARVHGIRGYDGELDDEQIGAFCDRVQKLLNDRKRDLERLQRDNTAEIDQKASAIAELEAKKSSLEKDRASAMERNKAIGKDVAAAQSELSSLNADEGAEAILQTEIQELESRIEAAKANEEAADMDAQITDAKAELSKLDAQAAKLTQELVECTRLSSERAQLDLRKKQIADRRRDLDVLKSTWNEKLSKALGGSWDPKDIDTEFHTAIKQQNDIVAKCREQMNKAQQELEQLDFKLSATRTKKTESSREAESCKLAVIKALKDVDAEDLVVDAYEQEVASIEKNLSEAELDLELFESMKKFYLKAEEHATKQNKCTLCSRSFGSDDVSRAKLLKKITDRVSNKEKDLYSQSAAERKEELRILRKVRQQYDTYRRLDAELPSLGEEVAKLIAHKDSLRLRFDDCDDAYRNAEERRQEVESLRKYVLKIAQTYKDIIDSEAHVERSQQSSSVVMRSPDEISAEQTACSEQTRSAQARLDRLKMERQRLKDVVKQLEDEKHEVRHKISKVALEVARRKTLQDTIQRHKEEQSRHREAIQSAKEGVMAIDPQITGARAALDDVRRQGREKEKRLADELDSIVNTVRELKAINSDIQEFLDRGGASNLAANQRAIASLEASMAKLENDMKDLTDQINQLNREIDNSDAKKRNIADNLTYRKNLREQKALELEIQELESRRAQEDYDRLIREAQLLDNRKSKLSANRERLMGIISSKDDELRRLDEEYNIDLKNARARYKESHVKVETTKAAMKDLGRGMVALENAILQYHSLKMEEVNRTIAELWQSTYQGTDIDTIQIRSNVEISKDANRRTYNYRVTMVKNDTDMDMRGRCSAGQKVLASIIIRLALAESFGVNCGMIALDEPTTNLDSDNIRSLAESLHAIIKARESQSNLQLIVITHDEEFLKHMQCSDFCDDFFRVRRDERQNSVIVRESITRITE
jgi:DNA repair protein RAD50